MRISYSLPPTLRLKYLSYIDKSKRDLFYNINITFGLSLFIILHIYVKFFLNINSTIIYFLFVDIFVNKIFCILI